MFANVSFAANGSSEYKFPFVLTSAHHDKSCIIYDAPITDNIAGFKHIFLLTAQLITLRLVHMFYSRVHMFYNID